MSQTHLHNTDSLRHFILTSDEKEIEKNISAIARSIGLIGESELIRTLARDLCRIAPSDVAVLIIGESGTGKDVAAKALHQLSPRRQKPLVIVNSGAIAEGILESELFGHERGSFTGAVSERKGYFETANGGTIFLDEIGEMPLATQVKLLRVLESGEFLKVGGSQVKQADVRVIAATNRSLEQMVRRGEFRKDLYYRLKAITLTMPTLRSRASDIPVLVKKFTDDLATQTHGTFKGFSKDAMEIMIRYRWPGNVRELKNFVESLTTIKRGEIVSAADVEKQLENFKDIDGLEPDERQTAHLPMTTHLTPEQAERELLYRTILSLKRDVDDIKHFLVAKFGSLPRTLGGGEVSTGSFPPAFEKKIHDPKIVETEIYNVDDPERDTMTLTDVERDMIIKALKKYGGRRNAAAKSLGLSERTLYRKIKEYHLDL